MSKMSNHEASVEDARSTIEVAVVNPIAAGLAHYTNSLNHVLLTCGVLTSRVEVTEPSSADYGKIWWLCEYLSRVRRGVRQKRADAVVAAWPAVGYMDLFMLTMVVGRRPVYLVMHDPRPLVYARGYGTIAKRLARRVRNGAIVAHSPDAVRMIVDDAKMPRVVEVLHPMLVPRQAPPLMGTRRNIRVLGQYKVDRDIRALEQLAANAAPDWCLEIIGRGWPAIEGWCIRSEFVAEADFDELIRTSHAVVVPYARFFQSGVAIRALEWGVPVVGPRASSLEIALGSDCRWLVSDGDWVSAVAAAVQEDREQVLARARDLYGRVIRDWLKMLKEIGFVG